MDNILIENEIARHNSKPSNDIDEVKKNESTKDNVKPSKINYKFFLEYMDTLRPNKKNYDVKLEIEKYRIWSKNAENAYH